MPGSDMQLLSLDDLTGASDRLHVAALRYVRAFERDELDSICPEHNAST